MPERHDFTGRQELASALADTLVSDLKAGIDERGVGSICVSGGSTPKLLFSTLAQRDDLDWAKVTVTLVDERWVEGSSDRSNAKLVRDHLLQGPASSAAFVPLFGGGDTPDDARIASLNHTLVSVPQPFDAVILGMGNDGHTASFFPDGDTLEAVLSDPGPVLALQAPGAGEPRVTWTLPRLISTRGLYLHIEGNEKSETLRRALGDGEVTEMPIRSVLRQKAKPVHIYWCP